MTIQEFIQKLGGLRGCGFYPVVLPGGYIRLNGYNRIWCPVTALCKFVRKQSYALTDFPEAAKMMGLSYDDGQTIAAAADVIHPDTEALRLKIMDALLMETPKEVKA